MRVIRRKTFETNSSSTHSLSISNYDKIEDRINELSNVMYDLDNKSDLCEALYLTREIERLIIQALREVEDK